MVDEEKRLEHNKRLSVVAREGLRAERKRRLKSYEGVQRRMCFTKKFQILSFFERI